MVAPHGLAHGWRDGCRTLSWYPHHALEHRGTAGHHHPHAHHGRPPRGWTGRLLRRLWRRRHQSRAHPDHHEGLPHWHLWRVESDSLPCPTLSLPAEHDTHDGRDDRTRCRPLCQDAVGLDYPADALCSQRRDLEGSYRLSPHEHACCPAVGCSGPLAPWHLYPHVSRLHRLGAAAPCALHHHHFTLPTHQTSPARLYWRLLRRLLPAGGVEHIPIVFYFTLILTAKTKSL